VSRQKRDAIITNDGEHMTMFQICIIALKAIAIGIDIIKMMM